MITVYYDGLCGLCSKEIRYYQRIAPPNTFRWVDVNQDMQALDAVGISLVDALKTLYVQTPDGVLHYGVDGFIVMWGALKGWRWLAKAVAFPYIKKVADILYLHFATRRFKRLRHCTLAQQLVEELKND